jgi:hypothetical protein
VKTKERNSRQKQAQLKPEASKYGEKKSEQLTIMFTTQKSVLKCKNKQVDTREKKMQQVFEIGEHSVRN